MKRDLKHQLPLATFAVLAFLIAFSALLLTSAEKVAAAERSNTPTTERKANETPEGKKESGSRHYGSDTAGTDSRSSSAYECYLTRVPTGEDPDYTLHETLILSDDLCSDVAVYIILWEVRNTISEGQ